MRNTPPQEADEYPDKVRTRLLSVDRVPPHGLMIMLFEDLG
jgi:hypothetical protein